MSRPKGYRVGSYGEMVNDRIRMDAYCDALERAVAGGATVLDIGAGTGIFSLLACKYGARQVFAVDPDDSILLTRDAALACGFDERISVIHDVSTAIDSLPSIDVVISDLRGVLPVHQRHVATIADARDRLLAPDGVLIGEVDVIRAALVSDQALYRTYDEPWTDNRFDLDLSSARPLVVNTWRRVVLGEQSLATEPLTWATWDYRTLTADDANVAGELHWEIEEPVVSHGLAVWFDAQLDQHAGFSNRPGRPELIYGQAFFPWSEPVPLGPGDSADVGLSARLVAGEYVWSWSIASRSVSLTQTTLLGSIVSPDFLRRRRADHVPALGVDGRIDGWMLARMDGARTLSEIAHESAAEFPERFESWTQALARAGELAARYGV